MVYKLKIPGNASELLLWRRRVLWTSVREVMLGKAPVEVRWGFIGFHHPGGGDFSSGMIHLAPTVFGLTASEHGAREGLRA